MKKLKALLLSILIGSSFFIYSQEKQIEQKENKVDTLYTTEEKNYMQKWLNDEVKKMNLTVNERAEYYRILLDNTTRMSRLNNKENNFTKKELKQKLTKQVDTMNIQIKNLLNEEQYKIHNKNFDLILWNVYLRNGWTKD